MIKVTEMTIKGPKLQDKKILEQHSLSNRLLRADMWHAQVLKTGVPVGVFIITNGRSFDDLMYINFSLFENESNPVLCSLLSTSKLVRCLAT